MNDIPVPDRLFEVFHRKRPMPLKMELRPTQRCNLNCRHCWRRAHKGEVRYDDELPAERFVELIREGAKLGVKKTELVGGGEPTFDPAAAMAYVREIKHQGMFGDLVTNGTRFTDEMIREIVELGWDRIMFSVDGANAHTHDYIRARQGVFVKAVTSIKRFTYWKRKLSVDRPLLGMIPVLTNRNYMQFRDFVELAQRVGAYHVGFKPMFAFHHSAKALMISEPQLLEMNASIAEAIPLAERFHIDTNLRALIHKPGNEVVKKAVDVTELYLEDVDATRARLADTLALTQEEMNEGGADAIYERFIRFIQIPCYLPWFHLTITANGGILPCTGAGSLDEQPNVRDASIEEILDDEIFVNFRNLLAAGKFPAACKECCVGLFLDNRRYREELVKRGVQLLENEARQIIVCRKHKRS